MQYVVEYGCVADGVNIRFSGRVVRPESFQFQTGSLMTRTFASIALLSCTLMAGCAADQSGATSPQADPGYTPTGSNIPRRAPAKTEPAAQSGGAPAAASK